MKGLAQHLGQSVALAPRRNLRDEATDRLRMLILDLTLPPGTPVPERDLAAAFGISRTPLKEALRVLETEGLVTYSATGRPRVSDPSAKDHTQVQATLAALELAALDVVLQSSGDLSGMETAQARIQGLGEDTPPLQFAMADADFHAALVRASGNEVLVHTHARLQPAILRHRASTLVKRKARKALVRDHADLLASVSSGSAKTARRLLVAHLSS